MDIGNKLICGKHHTWLLFSLGRTTPNKVWSLDSEKVLPFRHISIQGITPLLRRTWITADIWLNSRWQHTLITDKPCPHALEDGALKSPHFFKASAPALTSSNLPFIWESTTLPWTFTYTDFSQRCHGPRNCWPQSCCFDILPVC